jgi:hypothetical protein
MATTCRIIHSDVSGEATLYSGLSPQTTWSPALTNLQNPLLSAVARTTTLSGAQIGLLFGADVTISGAAVIGTNMSVDATYVLTAFAGSPSVQVFSTGSLPVWSSTKAFVDPDEKGLSFPILFGQNATGNDWLLTLDDPTNADGFIEVSKILLGTATESTFGFWDGAEFLRDPNTKVLTSLGGTRFYNRYKNIRRWTLAFPQETFAKAWDDFDQMIEVNGLDRSVYVVAYPDDTERMHQHSFMGTFDKTSPLRQLVHGRVGTGLDVIETV